MSEIANDEEPPQSVLKQNEGNDFLQLEIQRDGIIQSNVTHWHWQQFKMIKPNLKNDFSSLFNLQLGEGWSNSFHPPWDKIC